MNLFFTQYKHLVKEGGWVLSGQIITIIIQLIGIRIITEYLSADLLGVATLWLGVLVLLKSILIQPFLNYQIRIYPEKLLENSISLFNKLTFRATLILTLITISIFTIVTTLLFIYDTINSDYILIGILIAYFIFDILRSFYSNQLSAERNQKRIALWSIFENIIIYLSIFLILRINPTTSNYIASMTIGIMVGLIIFKGFGLNKDSNYNKDNFNYRSIFENAYKYAGPFIPIAMLSWIMNLSSRYFIGFLDSTYEAGLFVAAFSISSRPFTMLSGFVTSFLRPILFQASSNAENKKVNQINILWFTSVIFIGLIFLAILFFGGDIIANYLLAIDYRQNSTKLFLYIGIGYFGLAVFQIFENFLMAEKRTKEILYANVLGTLLFILLNIILIPDLASIGAAISIAIAFVFQAIVIFMLYINFFSGKN